ncbi:MAG: TraB/GumN family protein [Lepagella sp.]
MKNRLFAIILLFATCSVASQAQILYKVERPGSDKVSYILGTHHLAPLSAIDSIAELPTAINSVDRFYGELDMSQMTDPEYLMQFQGLMMAPQDSTLDKVLSDDQLKSVENAWVSLTGTPLPDALYAFKPAVLTTSITSIMVAKNFPQINPNAGIDMTMQVRAREAGKVVKGLETIEYQMDVLYGTPVSKQAKDLVSMTSDLPRQESLSNELFNAYLSHDIDAIYRLMEEEAADDKETFETLMYTRNDAWTATLSREMADESLMVVVGAGHLPGERGVLQGLKNAGYTITPIK